MQRFLTNIVCMLFTACLLFNSASFAADADVPSALSKPDVISTLFPKEALAEAAISTTRARWSIARVMLIQSLLVVAGVSFGAISEPSRPSGPKKPKERPAPTFTEVLNYISQINPVIQETFADQRPSQYPEICGDSSAVGSILLKERFGESLPMTVHTGFVWAERHYWLELMIEGRRYFLSFSEGQYELDAKLHGLREKRRYQEFARLYRAREKDAFVLVEINEDPRDFYRQRHVVGNVSSDPVETLNRPDIMDSIYSRLAQRDKASQTPELRNALLVPGTKDWRSEEDAWHGGFIQIPPDASSSETPWLPSERDMLELASQEKAVVFRNVTFSDPILRSLFELEPMLVLLITQSGGKCIDRFELQSIADKNNLSLDDLRAQLSVPSWAESILFTTQRGREAMGAQRPLLEEVFHLLEGGAVTRDASHRANQTYLDVQEIVNDFLQLMFYPADQSNRFVSHYTAWNEADRLALMEQYRDRPNSNPNEQLRDIVLSLQADVQNQATVEAGSRHPLISDLLLGDKRQYRDVLLAHLQNLLTTERFSAHKVLFPHLERVSGQGSDPSAVHERAQAGVQWISEWEPLKRYALQFGMRAIPAPVASFLVLRKDPVLPGYLADKVAELNDADRSELNLSASARLFIENMPLYDEFVESFLREFSSQNAHFIFVGRAADILYEIAETLVAFDPRFKGLKNRLALIDFSAEKRWGIETWPIDKRWPDERWSFIHKDLQGMTPNPDTIILVDASISTGKTVSLLKDALNKEIYGNKCRFVERSMNPEGQSEGRSPIESAGIALTLGYKSGRHYDLSNEGRSLNQTYVSPDEDDGHVSHLEWAHGNQQQSFKGAKFYAARRLLQKGIVASWVWSNLWKKGLIIPNPGKKLLSFIFLMFSMWHSNGTLTLNKNHTDNYRYPLTLSAA